MTAVTITTKERLMKLETNIDNIKKKLDDHATEQRIDFANLMEKLDNMQNSFAGKWVEKVILGLLITIISSIILLLMGGL